MVGQFTFIAISFYGLTIYKTHCALTFELKYLNCILFSQSFCGWIIYFKCNFIFTDWQLIKFISPRLWNNNISTSFYFCSRFSFRQFIGNSKPILLLDNLLNSLHPDFGILIFKFHFIFAIFMQVDYLFLMKIYFAAWQFTKLISFWHLRNRKFMKLENDWKEDCVVDAQAGNNGFCASAAWGCVNHQYQHIGICSGLTNIAKHWF